MMGLSLILGGLFWGLQTLVAHEGKDHPPGACEHLLSREVPGIQVIASGDATADVAEMEEVVHKITSVALDLGLDIPSQVINIVPADQLAMMVASGGGYPAPHWVHGYKISQEFFKSLGVMEFVTPGCPTCRSFYSANTPSIPQASIVMHVMGHNDVSRTSMYLSARNSDMPAFSQQMAEYLERLYVDEDHDKVSLFFQYLQSFVGLQDFSHGTFEGPELFVPGSSYSWKQTPSVLQALSVQLPSHAPHWQKQLMTLFEQSSRGFPGIAQTKVLNEGWATLMQYILARHTGWNTDMDLVEFAQLLNLVTGRLDQVNLGNPYWVGLTGWQNLYEQFLERPEVEALANQFEKDKAFIAWARKMYARKSDVEWARVALDRRWVEKYNLFLYRPVQYSEMNPSVPPEEQTHIALSRSPERIQNYIIRRIMDKGEMTPRLMLANPELKGFSEISLKQYSIDNNPMEIRSAVRTLFVLKQVMQRPVSLQMLLGQVRQPPPPSRNYDFPFGDEAAFYMPVREPELFVEPVRLRIDLDNKVYLFGRNEAGQEELDPQNSALLTQHLESFIYELEASFLDDVDLGQMNIWQLKAESETSRNVVEHSPLAINLSSYSSSAAHALEEFNRLVERRLNRAFEQTLKGKSSVRFGKSGVRVKAVPDTPSFQYDRRFIQARKSQLPSAPVDPSAGLTTAQFSVVMDDGDTLIGSAPYQPGDVFALPPPQEGEGQGEGEGEGQEGEGEGEPQSGEGQPGKSGQGSGDSPLGEVEVPIEVWQEFLSSHIELPNIRPTKGRAHLTDSIRVGSARKPNGFQLWDRIAVEAMNKARALRKAKGLPYGNEVPAYVLVREGMKYLEPSDIIVANRKELPKPSFDAVLVVNVDLTYSMEGERLIAAKNFMKNMILLLKARYKNLEVRYVGFSDKAQEIAEAQMDRAWMGGGTAYAPPLKLSGEILSEYPNSQYNKYVIMIGDAEAPDAQATLAALEEMTEDLQFFAMAVTSERANVGQEALVQLLQQFESEWPYIGTTIIRNRNEVIQGLYNLFPKSGGREEP